MGRLQRRAREALRSPPRPGEALGSQGSRSSRSSPLEGTLENQAWLETVAFVLFFRGGKKKDEIN